MNAVQLIASVSRNAGGLYYTVRRLSQCLYEAGCQVQVLAMEDELGDADNKAWRPIEPKTFPTRFPRMLGYAPEMGRELSRLNPDLVHSHGIWLYNSIAALGWERRSGKPLVVSPHGMLAPWAWKYRSWKKRPFWWVWGKEYINNAAVLHATAHSEAESLRRLGLRNPIAVIPNGVDLPHLREVEPRVDGLRTALFLSRIHPVKGILNLVEAWRQVRPEGWRVVVAGPDVVGHLAEVQSAVRRAGLQEQFVFTGPAYGDQKSKLYREADIFVLPTFTENFGNVIADALAYAVPVVTTKGAPWEELKTHRCGWWIDIGVEPLAAALREAISLPAAELKAMGLRGRKLVEERYSWPRLAASMKSMYDWTLGCGDKPDCVE